MFTVIIFKNKNTPLNSYVFSSCGQKEAIACDEDK